MNASSLADRQRKQGRNCDRTESGQGAAADRLSNGGAEASNVIGLAV